MTNKGGTNAQTDVGARTDRSSDLSASRDAAGRSSGATLPTTYPKRSSSPRMEAFDYIGGYRYHVVFNTYKNHPAFLQSELARIAIDSMFDAARIEGFTLDAYCVMPTHIHVLVRGDAAVGSSLRRFAHRFKQTLGYRFKQVTGQLLWHRSFYEHVLREHERSEVHAAYILGNPVRAGLTETIDAWPYSGPPNVLHELPDRSEDLSLRADVEALAQERASATKERTP